MAKTDVNQIFQDMIDDAVGIVSGAVKDAAKQVQKDIMRRAEENLQEYYDSHDPSIYKRTYRLRRSILPYYADRSSSKHISIEVGVQYKSSALAGAYRSNSWYHQSGGSWIERHSSDFKFDSQGNGIPEPNWIFENFYEGIHPITKVVVGQDGRRDYQYIEKKTKSQHELMKEFFDKELTDKVLNAYFMDALSAIISGRLK